MIKLIPIEDISQLKELCAQYCVDYNDYIHAYVSATDGLKAVCIFSLNTYNAEILAIDCGISDPLIPELLIRAVASYCANRSGYILRLRVRVGERIDSTLKTLRFEKNDDFYTNKVPEIMKGSCCRND